MAANAAVTPTAPKPKKHRSPAYPAVTLAQAIKRAEEFYAEEHTNPASFNAACAHWGYKPTSSGALLTAAALKSFGLLDELDSTSGRTFQISVLGRKIVADKRPNSIERAAAIKEAALRPKIHADLWRKYNGRLPSDAELTYRLEVDWEFNVNAIAAFIKEFRDTISFAKVEDSSATSGGDQDGEQRDETPSIKVGDYVQWTSQGMDQFVEPKRVREVMDSDKGQFVLVEGSDTGAPLNEVSVQEPPPVLRPLLTPKPSAAPVPAAKATIGDRTMRQEVFSLAEGVATLNWPSPLSKSSVTYLDTWLNLVKLKIKEAESQPKNFMEEKLASGECIDVGTVAVKVSPGVFRLQEFTEGMDYCDLVGRDWIRSVGKHKQTGEILASTGTEFYSNFEYECLFLR
jgi:hypothetical protein